MNLLDVVLALFVTWPTVPGVPPHLSVITKNIVFPLEEDTSVIRRVTCSVVEKTGYRGLVTYSFDWLDEDDPRKVYTYEQQAVTCPLTKEESGDERGADGTDRRA